MTAVSSTGPIASLPSYNNKSNVTNTNTALIFLKPHGQTQQVHDFLLKEFAANGLRIVRQGQIRGGAIRRNGTIDNHYAAIGLYAMKFDPRDLRSMLTKETLNTFATKYNLSFDDALSKGIIVNASECMRRHRWNAENVSIEFEKTKAETMLRLAPGCYTSRLANGTIVVNGFYLKMRSEYVHANAIVTWFVVEWDANALNWADFRATVLGATDPTKAPQASIRHKLLKNHKALGLNFVPSMASNCVHGSASPLEALNERLVWTKNFYSNNNTNDSNSSSTTQTSISDDVYGSYLLQRGLSQATITKMLSNAKVDGVPIFDIVEAMDSVQCAQKLEELSPKL